MSTMTDTETYNGYANRETWAFNLHWQNDQGLYGAILQSARDYLHETYGEHWTDMPEDERRGAMFGVGDEVVLFLENYLQDMAEDGEAACVLTVMSDVGSFWRIDRKEVGEAVLESLDIES